MKDKILGVALGVTCALLASAALSNGSVFAEGETYGASDFGGDAEFFKCIKEGVDAEDSATEVSVAAVRALTTLTCHGSTAEGFPNIKTVAGINLFTSLTNLNLYDLEKLESVDVSDNATLERLFIQDYSAESSPTTTSTLSQVKFKNNTSLARIEIHDTALQTISLAGAVNVNTVNLYNNKLTSVDLSKNTKMTWLTLSKNKLASIDLSNNEKLIYAYLYDNNFEYVDASKIVNANLGGLWLDDDVLVRTNFVATQITKGGNYYVSPRTTGSETFVQIELATGLARGNTKITTPGAVYYGTEDSDKCFNDAFCIMISANILDYQNYIQLEYIGDNATPDEIKKGQDPTKQNYRLEINLEAWDSIQVPDTGFFTGSINGTTIAISAGALVLGIGVIYIIVYSAKRGSHRSRFNKK